MNKRLYAGNLPYSMTEEELKSLFTSYGQVENVKLIVDKFTGRSKGFGFVELTNETEANAAIEKLNGSEVGGRKIIVNLARPMGEHSTSSQHGGGNGQRDRQEFSRRRDN
ncbi:MAG: RNA-binding protein [Elusimicrobiota bacterium]